MTPVDASGGVVYRVTDVSRAAHEESGNRQPGDVGDDGARGLVDSAVGERAVGERERCRGDVGPCVVGSESPQPLQSSYETGELQVLLIFRRGVWDLPKGKREPDETFETCAVREVAEETGADVELGQPLIDTVHQYEEGGERIQKTTRWFSMKLLNAEQELSPQQEEDIEALEWVPLDEAIKRVGFENLVQVLKAFEKSLPAS